MPDATESQLGSKTLVLHVDCGVFKVGNSLVMSLPKVITDNYEIKNKDRLRVLLHDNGIIIAKPVKDWEYEELLPKKENIERMPIMP